MTAEAAGSIPRLAAAFGRSSSWRRAVAALGLGLLAAGAMPPFTIVPLLAASLTGLAWLLDGTASRRRAFLDGWLWAMGFFVPSLHWIAISLFVDIGQFWWMVPFAVLGLPAYLACYAGAAAAATVATTRAGTLRRLTALAAWFVVGEWLRGHWLTGFPWLLAGYAWSADSSVALAVAQLASVIGAYGLSFVTVALAVLPARLGHDGPRWTRVLPVGLGALAWLGLFVWGVNRLQPGHGDPLVPGLKVRIVSTDLPHRAEWDPAAAAADFQSVLRLAGRPGLDGVKISVWPEGIVDAPLNRDATARQAVARVAPPGGMVLAGTLRATGDGAGLKVWNSVMAVDGAGIVQGDYDKHHLVPFGEYVPFHEFLSFSQIAAERLDFSVGPGPETVTLPGLPAVAPVICYEAIFPGEIAGADRPGWILNVTDDGWFGRSIGPAQHFAIARLRAIEEGLPLVRAANGGISGVVDPHGRLVAGYAVGETGPLDVALPMPLPERTLYGQWKNSSLVFIIILTILGSMPAGNYWKLLGRTFQRRTEI